MKQLLNTAALLLLAALLALVLSQPAESSCRHSEDIYSCIACCHENHKIAPQTMSRDNKCHCKRLHSDESCRDRKQMDDCSGCCLARMMKQNVARWLISRDCRCSFRFT